MRIEAFRVGKDLGIGLNLFDMKVNRIPLGQNPLTEPVIGRADASNYSIDRRPGPLDFQDRRLPEGATAPVGLLNQGRQHIGVPAQPLERPGERSCRGFMPCGHHCQQFIDNIVVRHGRTIVVAAAQHQREHVGSFG
ncbi:hypothetical protein NJB18001_26110 [Mycobacterium marinum]|nr:hypothetical protein KST_01563 [Mycobacterium marinum]GJP04365.1 hypothetical protein NJB18001_26110 [Mycobacterium marinum]